ncbi:MAG: UDP-3-O-acyl-N-acetylglucosamine deacetylase [Acetobacteraceae bacterium]|nr:UDP-3-O-acyl-N-acetylglucosamine deacetylase [Acetobacteraceae bacterium]
MDGLPQSLTLQTAMQVQRTLGGSIACVGVGLHSGRKTNLVLHPLPAGSGIVFRRTDLNPALGPTDIPARFDHVVDTRLCTVIGHPARPECRVGTIEHLMAALAGFGIDNALVEIDAPEVPILDGSAADFAFLITCAGVVEQHDPITEIEVLRTVRVEQGEAFAELRPNALGFDMALSIDFDAPAIGRQAYSMRLSPEAFRTELADSRTFTMVQEVEAMRAMGLALGGSLDNAIVVDGAKILNPTGLRSPDEFVRHKMLDAVGDLALSGAPLRARFVAHRTGHALNNKLLRALFADDANWRLVVGNAAASPLWQPISVAA